MPDCTTENAPQVLVVEDDPAIRSFIAEALVGVGYRVVESPDGEHALARLDTDPPDVVVLDLQLPKVDGWAILAALEEHPRKPPVVVMSAGANAKQRSGAIWRGGSSREAIRGLGAHRGRRPLRLQDRQLTSPGPPSLPDDAPAPCSAGASLYLRLVV